MTAAPAETGREAEDLGGIGSLAIVLHSHMPYVEGFGTYPFGEEWLFDAFARSYVPVLDCAERLTLTVTPVLADQLEAAGVSERLERFLRAYRLEACEADAEDLGAPYREACRAQAGRYRVAIERLEALGGDALAAFREPAEAGRIELMASTASHAVLPLVATLAGRRLQVDAGMRSHARRFGTPAGLWLAECAFEPGLERLLAERELAYTCVDQSAREPALAALAPIATGAGPVAFAVDWDVVSWLWSLEGYPSHPAHADFHRASMRGSRPWAIGGDAYRPSEAEATARAQAAEFVDAVAARLESYRSAEAREGLVVFAIDTELLGHWWWEGPTWLAEVLRLAPGAGVGLVTLSEALDRHDPQARPLCRSSWGEGKDLRTWDSPAVADLAWAARRLELRLLAALGSGLSAPAAERAARELLAVQASDWAFLDRRGQAGDYPWRRSVGHARAMLEAIHSADPPEPRLRNLAPDLSLAPLLEP